MAISSQGTSFTFTGITGVGGKVTSIQIEEGKPEVVDVTAITATLGMRTIVTTGDVIAPPRVSIEYMRTTADMTSFPPLMVTGVSGYLTIQHPAMSVSSVKATVDDASTSLAVGDAIRGKITFIIDKST